MGLRSGEYGGRSRSLAAAHIIRNDHGSRVEGVAQKCSHIDKETSQSMATLSIIGAVIS